MLDDVLGVLDRLVRELHERLRPFLPKHPQQRREVFADRRREMASVAAACARASEVSLEHEDVDALLTERQCRRKTRVAGANDDDICTLLSLKRSAGIIRLASPGADLLEWERHLVGKRPYDIS